MSSAPTTTNPGQTDSAAAPSGDLDPIFRALADPTRRALLDQLAQGPATTGTLVAAFPHLSRTGVMKHLYQLAEAGLVLVRRAGSQRWNHVNPIPIQRIYERWVAHHLRGLAASASRLKDHLENPS